MNTVLPKLAFLFSLGAGALVSAAAAAGTLDQVKQRGYLNCGANPGLAGFGLPDSNGNWTRPRRRFLPRRRRGDLQ